MEIPDTNIMDNLEIVGIIKVLYSVIIVQEDKVDTKNNMYKKA
jgi:hypothetical protein